MNQYVPKYFRYTIDVVLLRSSVVQVGTENVVIVGVQICDFALMQGLLEGRYWCILLLVVWESVFMSLAQGLLKKDALNVPFLVKVILEDGLVTIFVESLSSGIKFI